MEELLVAPARLLEMQKHKKGQDAGLSTKFALRDIAVLETIYSCGLRISELCGLCVDDIDGSEQVVRVRGKGKKERLVPIGQPALKAIENYWNTLLKAPAGSHPVFCSDTKKAGPLSPLQLSRRLKNYLRDLPGWDRSYCISTSQLCDAPAGCRCGLAQRAGIAWSCASYLDASLHPCLDGAFEKGLRRGASAGVEKN